MHRPAIGAAGSTGYPRTRARRACRSIPDVPVGRARDSKHSGASATVSVIHIDGSAPASPTVGSDVASSAMADVHVGEAHRSLRRGVLERRRQSRADTSANAGPMTRWFDRVWRPLPAGENGYSPASRQATRVASVRRGVVGQLGAVIVTASAGVGSLDLLRRTARKRSTACTVACCVVRAVHPQPGHRPRLVGRRQGGLVGLGHRPGDVPRPDNLRNANDTGRGRPPVRDNTNPIADPMHHRTQRRGDGSTSDWPRALDGSNVCYPITPARTWPTRGQRGLLGPACRTRRRCVW